ncbi:MAG: tRNA (adenosine(37)-N6)-dimethylallyltransferase MiaA [Bacteroidetes bacterium GWA2_30_7]|nr:MAG: tRNA (adenosine(37)-N6)-dimethylallyltransferase MiaA [Bacteroidetes bacterium GWA2_30_7]
MPKTLIVILGPTAVGKTDISLSLAKKINTEIISCDSRQFYRELNIGTAKPSENQLNEVKHHFIGHISIHDYYNVSKFEIEALKKINELFKISDYAIMVGGSGLYIDAVCQGIDDLPEIDKSLREQILERFEKEGIESLRIELKRLDPEYYAIVDLKNKNRMLRAVETTLQTGKPFSSFRTSTKFKRDFNIIKIGLNFDRDVLYNKINLRVDLMVENGLVEEAKEFFKNKNLNALNTVGYKELFGYFENDYTLEKAIELIKRNSRHYAKKQLTWFGRYNDINWFNPNDFDEILRFLKL